jgi:HEAT repeat protein
MDISAIATALSNPDFQYRLKAITALKPYPPDVAVPLILSKLHDPEFLVRTFVARELGHQQTADGFAGLLELTRFDNTPNVRAEAANSLSLFGQIAVSHLVQIFHQDEHWLVRRSILATLTEMAFPHALLEVCQHALTEPGVDQTVQESAVDATGSLAHTNGQAAALTLLLTLVNASSPRIRIRAAYALKHFKTAPAQAALAQLRRDSDHRVVGAALEDLLPPESV